MIIAGVGLSVLAVVLVGIFVARKVDGDSANYLVAGRRLGVPLVAASLMAAAVDSNATVGNTDLTSSFGFWAGASLALGLAICLLLTGLFLAKPMNRMKLFTLADFYRLRYGRGVEVASSVFMIFAFAILMAGNLVACGYLLERFLGLDYTIGVLVAVGLVLVYTIGGGMFSDAYTAAIQIVITIVATACLVVWFGTTYGFEVAPGMGRSTSSSSPRRARAPRSTGRPWSRSASATSWPSTSCSGSSPPGARRPRRSPASRAPRAPRSSASRSRWWPWVRRRCWA